MARTEEYKGNGVSGNNEGSVNLLADSGASEHYFDDHSELRKWLSD